MFGFMFMVASLISGSPASRTTGHIENHFTGGHDRSLPIPTARQSLSRSLSPPNPGSSVPIVGGTIDSAHPSVGALVARRHKCTSDQIGYVCTVTLLAPRVALTAAHCLDIYGPAGPYEVLFTDRVDSPDPKAALVLRTLRHPGYNPQAHDLDLALLVLDRAVPIEPVVPIDRLLDATDIGRPVTAVGFGLTDPNSLGTYGTKRRGEMTITEVDGDSFETEPGPSMTCSGDSGGPLFVDGTEGGRLVGVTASGDQACRTYAHNIQVAAAWSDFIQPVLDQVAAEALPSEEGTISLEALCENPCTSDDDCPAHLKCMPGPSGTSRCVLPGLIPGGFAGKCSTDQDCRFGTCARIRPSGADSCLCLVPCDQMSPPDGSLGDGALLGDGGGSDVTTQPDGAVEPGPGRGCGCREGSHPGGSDAWWWILLPIVVLRATKKQPVRNRKNRQPHQDSDDDSHRGNAS